MDLATQYPKMVEGEVPQGPEYGRKMLGMQHPTLWIKEQRESQSAASVGGPPTKAQELVQRADLETEKDNNSW